jgi:hypothetical protein
MIKNLIVRSVEGDLSKNELKVLVNDDVEMKDDEETQKE